MAYSINFISDTAFTFEDGTLMGGTQPNTETVKWRHSFNVTKTERTSPRGGAGARTMQALYYADLPEMFGKAVNTQTSGWLISFLHQSFMQCSTSVA